MDNINNEITYTVAHQISEECDRFVLQTISNSIYRNTKTIIPKKLIMEALISFKREHPDAYELYKNIPKEIDDSFSFTYYANNI